MLKLSQSYKFCRLAYENIICQRVLVEQYTHLLCRGKTCILWNSADLLSPFHIVSLQSRLLSNIKRRNYLKKSHVPSAIRNQKQMNNSLQPTSTNFSYGGHFEISTDGGPTTSSLGSSNDNKQTYIAPNFRVWEPVEKKNSFYGGFRFKLMSYNVLAQYLLEWHPYLYTECGVHNLKWKERAAKIYDEILSLSPDILCLQEVQVSHLSSFYKKIEELGYDGVFKQKTGQRQDGCAIYFKRSLFDLKDHITVEFYQPEIPILNRDNVGLMVKLAPK